ncbi:hypothetical protein D3C72_472200 [compost metagenome]
MNSPWEFLLFIRSNICFCSPSSSLAMALRSSEPMAELFAFWIRVWALSMALLREVSTVSSWPRLFSSRLPLTPYCLKRSISLVSAIFWPMPEGSSPARENFSPVISCS